MKLYQKLALLVAGRINGIRCNNTHYWMDNHAAYTAELVNSYLPQGNGFAATKLELDDSTGNQLIFTIAFHHMPEELGGDDCWTEHSVIVSPDLIEGFTLIVTGENRDDIKARIAEEFYLALMAEVKEKKTYIADMGAE